MNVPEPWMFGIEATVDGVPVRAQIGRFSLWARFLMGLRVMRGKPAFKCAPYRCEQISPTDGNQCFRDLGHPGPHHARATGRQALLSIDNMWGTG